ncbi:MAG: HAMP domain-containing protein [Rhodospirillaceae bacterium]|nr:HAMP domain-containing protein [Rhodospirillaceae bacterium]
MSASPPSTPVRLLRSTSVRLALGYALLFILSSVVLGGLLWWRTTDTLDQAIEAAVIADTRAIGDRLRDFGLAGAVETINTRIRRVGDQRAIYLLTDPQKRSVTGNLNAWPPDVGDQTGWYMASLVREERRRATRILHVQLPNNYRLLVGRDIEDREELRELVFNALGWTAAAAIALAVVGGFLVRRAALGRIEEINRTASDIVRGDLKRRLPSRDSGDEFDQLALTINGMLDQIQQLIEGLQATTHAVAHDLRTPLAELRGRLEALLRARPSHEATLEEVQEAVDDVDRVIEIFNALLRLAEIDSGTRRSGFRTVDLAEIAAEAAELYRPIVEERGAELAVEAPAHHRIEGDPFLIAQAIGNLLDNAAKVAPRGSVVTLTVAGEDGRARITVSDRGPGIPDHEKPRVVERFFRGDAARATSGVGLGLSVVAAVARLHGGTLTLEDNDPGLKATISLGA